MQKEINQTWFFQRPPQEVWEYLTKPELLEIWLGKTDIQPIVGYKFRFASPNGNDAQCEVLEVQRFVKLSYSWQKRSVTDNKSYTSKVMWTLAPTGDGTELQLVHNGFSALEDVAGHLNGWKACLTKFEKLLKNVPDGKA